MKTSNISKNEESAELIQLTPTLSSNIIIHKPENAVGQDTPKPFGAVLKKYRKLSHMSIITMAEVMNVSKNTILNWESGRANPSIVDITSLCTLLGIPLYELFGITDIETPSKHEHKLLTQYRKLSSVSKKIVDRMVAGMLLEETDARDHYLHDNFIILPMHSTPAAAGTGCAFNELPPEPVFIRRTRCSEASDMIIRVSGRSMEPIYHDADLVYVKQTKTPEDGSDVICSTADGAVIKRAVGHKLYSLNNDYPFGEKNEDDHVVVIGKVLGIVGQEDPAHEDDLSDLESIFSDELRDFRREYKTEYES